MKFQIGFVGFLFCIFYSMENAGASNILGMFLTHSPSHLIIHMGIVRALIERGHNVTVVSSMPSKDANLGYRHIHLKTLEFTKEEKTGLVNGLRDAPAILKPIKAFTSLKHLFDKMTLYKSDPAFIEFMKEDNHFDLMILGYGFNEFILGLGAHFKCSTVISFPLQPFGQLSRIIGQPNHPSFVPFAPFMDPGPMNFYRRVVSFIACIIERIVGLLMDYFSMQLYNENFPSDKYPSYSEIKNNVSLVFVNHHFSEGPVRPLIPGLVEIGGVQIKDKPDPLPEDVEEFLNSADRGVIFFSLGSNARGDQLGPNGIDNIYKSLSKLPYKVFWKFDDEQRPGNASNIMFKKWFPQDDILAHKNLKLFVTHAGKGSITESEFHEVPMVAIPVFADQPTNAEVMQSKGHGIVVDFRTMTEESFKEAITEVIENPKYRNKLREFSRLYKDRPLTARQNAAYWIEYVIRHRGAPHMQSPLKEMNFFQENSIDVILFLIVIVYLCVKILKALIKLFVYLVIKSWKVTKSKRD